MQLQMLTMKQLQLYQVHKPRNQHKNNKASCWKTSKNIKWDSVVVIAELKSVSEIRKLRKEGSLIKRHPHRIGRCSQWPKSFVQINILFCRMTEAQYEMILSWVNLIVKMMHTMKTVIIYSSCKLHDDQSLQRLNADVAVTRFNC